MPRNRAIFLRRCSGTAVFAVFRFAAFRFMCAGAQIAPLMYATAQKPLRRRSILATVKLCTRAIVQNVSVRTDKWSVECVDGFLDQTKGASK